MMNATRNNASTALAQTFGDVATFVARQAGKPAAFVTALGVIIAWALTGPLFNYSDTWQLVVNTGTTIVTFLMVFLIQNSQNRDGVAIQVKLDELIRVGEGKNFFVGIEHLADEEIERLRDIIEKRARSRAVKRVQDKAEKAIDEAE